MRSIAEHQAANLSLRKNCRVEQVRRHEKSWHLYLEGGAEVNGFDGLIISVPPAQAAALLNDFNELKSACLQENMAPCWSVFVSFESRLDIPYDGLFVHQSPLSWICRDSSKPGRPPGERWVLHGSAAWSSQHLEEDGAAVASQLLAELFRATAVSVVKETFISAHRWRYAIPEASNRSRILLSEADALAVCGDWCHGARVEGAYLSGCEAAAFIGASLH